MVVEGGARTRGRANQLTECFWGGGGVFCACVLPPSLALHDPLKGPLVSTPERGEGKRACAQHEQAKGKPHRACALRPVGQSEWEGGERQRVLFLRLRATRFAPR